MPFKDTSDPHITILTPHLQERKINESPSVPCVFYEKSVGIGCSGCSGCLDKTYGETNNYIPVPPANDINLYETTFVDTSYIEVISDIPSENEHEIIEITKIIEKNSYINSSLNESNFIDSDITTATRRLIDSDITPAPRRLIDSDNY